MVGIIRKMSPFIVIKAKNMDGSIRRFRMGAYNADMDRLVNIVRSLFGLVEPSTLTISYRDHDGDLIEMSSDMDFVEACYFAVLKDDGERELVIYVDDDPTPSFEVNVPSASDVTKTVMDRLSVISEKHRAITATMPLGGKVTNVSEEGVEFGEFECADVSPRSYGYESVDSKPMSHLGELELDEEEVDLLENSSKAEIAHAVEIDLGCVHKQSSHITVIREREQRRVRLNKPQVTIVNAAGEQKEFKTPFPAFVSFPQSPTACKPIFSLSEHTAPFPFFPTVSSTPTKTAFIQTPIKITRTCGTSTDDLMIRTTSVGVSTGTETSTFNASTQVDEKEIAASIAAKRMAHELASEAVMYVLYETIAFNLAESAIQAAVTELANEIEIEDENSPVLKDIELRTQAAAEKHDDFDDEEEYVMC